MTPLLYACSTGLADVVVELAERQADMNVVDENGRGCLQLAMYAQGANQPLAQWLRENTAARDTDGWGREDQVGGAPALQVSRAPSGAHAL